MLKIRERYNQMSKGDKRISDFVLENHDRLLGMTAAAATWGKERASC